LKKSLVLMVVCLFVLALVAGCASDNKPAAPAAPAAPATPKTPISLVVSNSYAALSTALTTALNAKNPTWNVTAKSTGTDADNIQAVNKKDADFAIVPTNLLDAAVKGVGDFKDKATTDIREVANLFPGTTLIANKNVSEDAVYNFTETLTASKDELAKTVPSLEGFSLDKALSGLYIPVHPGAMKFFTEKGITIPGLTAQAPATPTAPAVQAPAAPAAPVAVAHHSDFIKKVQTKLNDSGYRSGPVDGIKGPMTTRAVKAFQKAKGLSADGIIGPRTREALAI
jgi:hypothetical protein